jgi:serine/threonine protein kinase
MCSQVYKGTLPTGVLVAIKRAKQGSLQGSHEFKTEIELLSRVHHKNLVSLLGFCYQLGEQMLVYEYIKNGTLTDCISGIFTSLNTKLIACCILCCSFHRN